MYYKQNSNEYPIDQPTRIRLDNGLTISNPTREQLFENGWCEAPIKPSVAYPQRVDWIDCTWVIREPNQAEIDSEWATVRQRCQQLLNESDYRVIKATELAAVKGTSLATELSFSIITYRQTLRDIYNNTNNLNPFFITWPTLEETVNGN